MLSLPTYSSHSSSENLQFSQMISNLIFWSNCLRSFAHCFGYILRSHMPEWLPRYKQSFMKFVDKKFIYIWDCSVALSSPGSSNSKLSFTTTRSTENSFTAKMNKLASTRQLVLGYLLVADNNVLGVREHGSYILAGVTFNIHEEWVGGLNKLFKFIDVLLIYGIYVQKVDFH